MFDLNSIIYFLLIITLSIFIIIIFLKKQYSNLKGISVIVFFIIAIIFFIVGIETLGDTDFYLNIAAIFFWSSIMIVFSTIFINLFKILKNEYIILFNKRNNTKNKWIFN